jgi:anti-sigma regulatory factor (Ser/Thr protein kinase)
LTERVNQPLIRVALPRTPEAGAIARGLISRHLAPQLEADALLHARLIASELVNNAYQHGRGQIRLEVQRFDDRLRIEVIDEGEGVSVKINEQPSERGGRGLRIVDSVATQWGACEGTTHVWVDLAI